MSPMQCVCGYTNESSNLRRHQRTCKLLHHPFVKKLQQENESLQDEVSRLKCQLEALLSGNETLKEENADLQSENKSLQTQLNEQLRARLDETTRPLTTNNTTHNNNTHNTQNIHNNVTIVLPYGQEPDLTKAQVNSILSCIPSESVPKYVEMKHFSRPETSNIRITNKRGNTMQVLQQTADQTEGKRVRRWVDRDRKEMVSDITERSLDELVDNYNAVKHKPWKMWYEASQLDKDGFDKTQAFRELVKKVDNLITSQNPRNLVT